MSYHLQLGQAPVLKFSFTSVRQCTQRTNGHFQAISRAGSPTATLQHDQWHLHAAGCPGRDPARPEHGNCTSLLRLAPVRQCDGRGIDLLPKSWLLKIIFRYFSLKKLQTSTKNKRRQEVNENTLRKTMETAREVHYPVSGNCPGKQTGSEPGHTLKSQHYLLEKTSGGGGSFQHIFTDCNYISQYKKTLGTFISKITAEHHLLSICLSTVFFIYAHTT